MATKKRSFRLNPLQAEVVKFALLYFLASLDDGSTTLSKAFKESAETLYQKLENYQWEVTTNEP